MKPNIDRKWNEADGYDWTTDSTGVVIALTSVEVTEAATRAARNPEDRTAYVRRCRRSKYAFVAAYFAAGFALGSVLLMLLCRYGHS